MSGDKIPYSSNSTTQTAAAVALPEITQFIYQHFTWNKFENNNVRFDLIN